MNKIVNQQNIAHYPHILELIQKSESLFRSIQVKEMVVPLQAEEKLFIEVIMGMNQQATSRVQKERVVESNENEEEVEELKRRKKDHEKE